MAGEKTRGKWASKGSNIGRCSREAIKGSSLETKMVRNREAKRGISLGSKQTRIRGSRRGVKFVARNIVGSREA